MQASHPGMQQQQGVMTPQQVMMQHNRTMGVMLRNPCTCRCDRRCGLSALRVLAIIGAVACVIAFVAITATAGGVPPTADELAAGDWTPGMCTASSVSIGEDDGTVGSYAVAYVPGDEAALASDLSSGEADAGCGTALTNSATRQVYWTGRACDLRAETCFLGCTDCPDDCFTAPEEVDLNECPDSGTGAFIKPFFTNCKGFPGSESELNARLNSELQCWAFNKNLGYTSYTNPAIVYNNAFAGWLACLILALIFITILAVQHWGAKTGKIPCCVPPDPPAPKPVIPLMPTGMGMGMGMGMYNPAMAGMQAAPGGAAMQQAQPAQVRPMVVASAPPQPVYVAPAPAPVPAPAPAAYPGLGPAYPSVGGAGQYGGAPAYGAPPPNYSAPPGYS